MKAQRGQGLTRESVADRALVLADAEGLEALTIRRLADDLHVTPMALYWHFRNKEELLVSVFDRIWHKVDYKRDPTLEPLDQYRALFESMVNALRTHRQVVALLTTTGGELSAGFLGVMETSLDILADLGFTPEQASSISLYGLCTAAALVIGEPGVPSPGQTADETAETIRGRRLALETLPMKSYPRIVGAAVPLTSCENPDAHYSFGTDMFIAGLKATIPHP